MENREPYESEADRAASDQAHDEEQARNRKVALSSVWAMMLVAQRINAEMLLISQHLDTLRKLLDD